MGKVKDALNWIMNVETSVKEKVEEMADEVKEVVSEAAATEAATPVADTLAATVVAKDEPTVDTDAAIANLKAFLITAGYTIPVFDQLASAAKALATK